MKRILVYISNADLKKKILALSSKLESYNFIFLCDIDGFIGEFKIIQPDILIVGDQEFKKLAINTACHTLINSISKLILARNDSKETLITSGLNPVILQPDFDITDLKQLTTPINEFNDQSPDKKQPKINLRDEKQYLQILMDSIPDTIYFKDSSSKYIRVNQARANIFGLKSPDEVIGKTDFDFFPEEQARIYFQDELDIMKSGEPIINQIEKVNRADGSTFWVSSTKIPIKDDDGAIVGLVGVSRDVTTFKMKLQQEKSLLNGLLNNIPDLIYFKDLESRFIRINKAHAKTIGIQNPKDANGKKDSDFFDESHSVDAYNAEQEMMRTGEPILNKLEHIKTKDGYRYVTTTKIPLKDDQGAIIGMVGVTRDVTKSHNLEMKLQQETNLLNALLNSVPDSIYFKNKESQFIRVSKSWIKKHNIPDGEDIIGKTDADFLDAEFARQTLREEQIMMETGIPVIDKLQSKLDPNGKVRYDMANKIPMVDHNNSIVGLFGISRDITELKNTELKLNKEKELLQSLMDNIPDTIYFKDTSSKFTKINQAQASSLGVQSPDEAVGKTDFDFFDKTHALAAFKDEQEMMKTGLPVLSKLEYVKTATGYRYVTATKIPIKDQLGKVTGIVGVSRDVTESHNLEMKLQQETNLLNALLDNVPDSVYFKDKKSKFLRVSKSWLKKHSLGDAEDVIGKTDAHFSSSEFAKATLQEEQFLMQTGEPLINKIESFLDAKGKQSHKTVNKIPFYDVNNKVAGMVGISHDITELKNTELKLNKEKELLQTLMDNIPDFINFKDSSSKFTRINQAQVVLMGLQSPDDAFGKGDFDFFPEEQAKLFRQDEIELMQSGKPLINRIEKINHADGRVMWVSATKIPVKDQYGKATGIVGVSRDITELKNTEFKLNKEKELLQSLMDNIPDTIYFKDALSRFTRINQAQANSLGVPSPDDAIGKTDFDFSPKEQATLSFQDELDIMKSGKPLINRVEKVNRADGSVIWVSTTKIPVKDQFGKVSGTVGMSRDITVLEEARNSLVYAMEKAEEANKAKSLFLANMSHEIRTPMNGVIGMSDVLGQTALTDEQREYLTIITKSGSNLLSIINNILDFSKIESGSLELEKAPISIRQVIENVADVLITSASNKGVDLMNYVDSSIPDIVEGDSVRLSQVLINLVNNALKFTDHGEVYFTAELTESTEVTFKVLFKVKDNGIGISQEAQQKIFHSFTQVDSSTTRKYGGTGLGLAISKRLVEMMGGTIGVESVLGEGSLFWFTAKFGVSSQKKQIKLTTKLLIDGLKVLIVDDNRTNRFVFGKYLEIWNCKYDQAENGEIALKMLIENAERNSPYDVALIDYQMEKMDGLKLAEQIQKNSQISSTRLILLSSVTDVIPRSEVARRGFNYFLNKPVKLKELYDVITSVTGNSAGDKLKQAINSDEFTPNLSVLVAEDNPTNLKVAQLILKPFINAFDSAENGLIAFEKFKANKYDVIFMDIQMPVMNGYEAVKSIRDYEAENNLTPVKIVAMTANAMKEDVEQCLSSGMNEYLSKPFRRDDMFKIIEKLNLR